MEKILESTLRLLGLGQKEIRFFLATFKMGPCSIQEISKEARLERSTAYLIAKDLIARGYIEENYHLYRKKLNAIEPKGLLRMIFAKERGIGRKGLELEERLPDLQMLYQASEIRPRVKVYEGKEGLTQIHEDILSVKQEILLWTNQESERFVFDEDHHRQFIADRLRKHISIRVLAVNNEQGKKLTTMDEEVLRKTKILPRGTTFTPEIYIYGSKIAILDYKKDIIGVILESEPIAASQRAIFEMNWTMISSANLE